MVQQTRSGASGEKETGRLEAFSDGVFAIAITLLALELHVPHVDSSGGGDASAALVAGLRSQWPGYLAFVTSFFTVLIMWVYHHNVFRFVHHVDTRLLFANGFLLLLVTAVPFPTAVIAEYLETPAAPAASALYSGVFVLISIAFNLLQMTAFRESTLAPAASEAEIQRLRRSSRLGPPLYLIAFLAAPFSPWLAMGICSGLWIFWAIRTRTCAPAGNLQKLQ